MNNTETSKAYRDGYEIGSAWNLHYRPGGPWVSPLSAGASQKDIDLHRETAKRNKAWLAGFDAGRKYGETK